MKLDSLNRNFTEAIILKTIKEKPIHGYGIQQIVKQKYGLRIHTSTLYTMLIAMEKKKLIHVTETVKPRTKIYAITGVGAIELKEFTTELRVAVAPLLY